MATQQSKSRKPSLLKKAVEGRKKSKKGVKSQASSPKATPKKLSKAADKKNAVPGSKPARKRAGKGTSPISSKVPSTPLAIGKPALEFSLPDDHGQMINLSDYRGKKVVLYFYPKDNTPGCTREACAFRNNSQALQNAGAVVLGVSADSVHSHRKFSDKFELDFPLLSDESKAVLQAYGVWKEKSLYGRKFMGIERTTVLINEKGVITHVFPKVKVDGHVAEVLDALN